jgi:hypothetical protein
MDKCFLERPCGQRTLPLPSAELFRDAVNGNPTWAALCTLEKNAVDDGWLGLRRRRAGELPIAALLRLHRKAFEAECAGRVETAAYFWDELLRRLRKEWSRNAHWETAARMLERPEVLDGAALRVLLTDELFLDSMFAFVNGRIDNCSVTTTEHLSWQGTWIEAVLTLRKTCGGDPGVIRLPLIKFQINALMNAGGYNEAIHRLRNVTDPKMKEVLSERLANLELERACKRLNDDATKNTTTLRQVITELEIIVKAHPDRLPIQEILGQAYHLLSVQLANDDACAQALVASQKAMLLCPALSEADEAFNQLVERMQQLKSNIDDVMKELKRDEGKQLSEAGKKLFNDAKAGFGPLEAFRQSTEAAALSDRWIVARDAGLWRELAGEPLPTRPTDGALAALRETVITIFSSEASAESELAQAFDDMKAASTDLPAVDARRVASFIVQRRRESGEQADSDAQSEDTPAGNAPAESDLVPTLMIPPASPVSGDRVSFREWFAGSGDTGARSLAVAAALSVVVAGVFSAIEIPAHRTRDEAVMQITSASSTDYDSIIEASERFLQARPFGIGDPREASVRNAYANAFLGWFTTVENPGEPQAAARIDTYRKLASQGEQS